MNVLMINHNAGEFGTFYRFFYIGKHLAARGHSVTLMHMAGSFKPRVYVRNVSETFRLVETPPLELGSGNLLWLTGSMTEGFINTIVSQSDRFDICVFGSVCNLSTAIPAMAFLVNRFLKLKTAKILIDSDDWWTRGGLTWGWGRTANLVGRLLEDGLPKYSNGITVVSELLRKRFISVHVDESKIYKIPNGSRVDEIKPLNQEEALKLLGITKDAHLLVVVGYSEGLHVLFRALRILKKVDYSNLICYLVGLSKSSSEAISARALQINDMVNFIGRVPYSSVPVLLAAADLLILPMGTSVMEQARWPIRLGDYLASGRCILAGSSGEVGRIFEEEKCGLLYQPDDPSDLAEKIGLLLEDEALRMKLGVTARRTAETKYDWRILVAKLEAILSRLS